MKEVLKSIYTEVKVDSKRVDPSDIKYKDGDEMYKELLAEKVKDDTVR